MTFLSSPLEMISALLMIAMMTAGCGNGALPVGEINPATMTGDDTSTTKGEEIVANETSSQEEKLISPQQLYELLQKGEKPLIFDVRTSEEFNSGHVPGAINVPLAQLVPTKLGEKYLLQNKKFYVICQLGGRSAQATEQFVKSGFPRAVDIKGGTATWQKAGFPMTTK